VQDPRQEDPASATDIDDPAEAREVIRGHDVVGLLYRPARHRRLERGLVLAVATEVFEELLAVHALERSSAGAHGVEQTRC
jgi:hypothetical protein